MTTNTCPKCHGAVEPQARFCPKCGQTMLDGPLCPACAALNQAGAHYCFKCGAPLSGAAARSAAPAAPAAPGTGGPSYASSLQDKIDSRIQGVQDRLRQRLGGLDEGAPAAGRAAAPAGAGGHALIHQSELQAVYSLDPGELNQAALLVRTSRMIQNNPVYKARAEGIHFVIAFPDPSVNAFATDQPLEVPGNPRIDPPAIVFFAGLAHAAHLGAAAMAVYLQTREEQPLRQVFKELGRAIVEGGGLFSQDAYNAIFEKRVAPAMGACLERGDDRFTGLAQSIRFSMFMEVIAHEVGHVVLCHTLGQAFNYDMSRNQEREADSVAASILSTCPYREYHFLGQALGNIIFVWLDSAAGDQAATTHPLSRERFASVFVNNSEAAAEAARAFGLGREQLEELLPPRRS